MAKALITGASSGIGKDIAKGLAKRGYEVILVARNEEKLNEVKAEIGDKATVIPMDISVVENCKKLHEMVGYVDILVNNAGFGVFGKFSEVDLDRELTLIDTNITAVHVLTKLFLKDMIENNNGYILNVASIAGHMPGPLMDSYYASKEYVYTLSTGINEELRREKLNVKVGTLNPGPVLTNFNKVANANESKGALSSEYVAEYTIKNMLKGKTDITPGASIKFLRFIAKILPSTTMAKFVYIRQTKKEIK